MTMQEALALHDRIMKVVDDLPVSEQYKGIELMDVACSLIDIEKLVEVQP